MNNLNKIINSNSTDLILENLLSKFKRNRRPIKVDFRKLVSWLHYGERATHFIHPYPAKLLFHIPYFFLSNDILSKPGDTIIDPFCGTGTVMLESTLLGRNGIGFDINPLACLIARTKTSCIEERKLKLSIASLKRRIYDVNKDTDMFSKSLSKHFWFFPRIIRELESIKNCISKTKDSTVKNFFLVSFSNLIRKVSLADPRVSVPVKLRCERLPKKHKLRQAEELRIKRLRKADVSEMFFVILEKNLKRVIKFNEMKKRKVEATVIHADFRSSETQANINAHRSVKDGRGDLIITSPPYAGAQKYMRASKLNIELLEMCPSWHLKEIEENIIGREFYRIAEYKEQLMTGIRGADKFLRNVRKINPLRAHVAAKYLLEMRDSFKQMYNVLKPGGYLVIVIGDNSICGAKFLTHKYLEVIARETGFETVLKLVNDIQSRGLMTKRNTTSGIITEEWVLVCQKNNTY